VTLPSLDASTLFTVSGKSAVIVGATGAFGTVACATLGRAGENLTVTAGNVENLDSLKRELDEAAISAVAVSRRPDSEAACEAIVGAAVSAFGGVDILVVASGGIVVFTSSARGKLVHR
jgi:NADP-dependent 3-hydroxy acid dehydrogenase YdfG